METLKKLQEGIEELNKLHLKQVSKLESAARAAFYLTMQEPANKAVIQSIVSALETSRDLTDVEHDEYPHAWVRVEWSEIFKLDTQFLKDLMREYLLEEFHVEADFKHNAATYCIGPCIIVNDDGDVLDQDSGKWFLKRGDYETIEERNEKIEEYMEKSGYFPSVVSYGRYGVNGYINTQKQKKRA